MHQGCRLKVSASYLSCNTTPQLFPEITEIPTLIFDALLDGPTQERQSAASLNQVCMFHTGRCATTSSLAPVVFDVSSVYTDLNALLPPFTLLITLPTVSHMWASCNWSLHRDGHIIVVD